MPPVDFGAPSLGQAVFAETQAAPNGALDPARGRDRPTTAARRPYAFASPSRTLNSGL